MEIWQPSTDAMAGKEKAPGRSGDLVCHQLTWFIPKIQLTRTKSHVLKPNDMEMGACTIYVFREGGENYNEHTPLSLFNSGL